MLKMALLDCAINEKCCSVVGGRGICRLFSSPLRGIWLLKSPHPRESAIQGQKMPMSGGQPGGGGERGAGRRWNWLIHKMNNNFTRLEDAIYYILRTLFRTKDESFESLLNLVGMDTLKHRRYYQALMLIYKCLYSIGPKYIADSWNKGCML